MNETLGGFREFVNERLGSPLLGTYLVSWPVCNFKVILYIFSDIKVEEKIQAIDSILFSSLEAMQHSFGIPLIIALGYVFLLPFPTTVASVFTLWVNHFNRRLKQVIESQSLLSKEEAKMIIANSSRKEDELEDKISRRDQQIERLNQMLTNKQEELDAADTTQADLKAANRSLEVNYSELVRITSNLAAAHEHRNLQVQKIAGDILNFTKVEMDGERKAVMSLEQFESLFTRVESLKLHMKKQLVGDSMINNVPDYPDKK